MARLLITYLPAIPIWIPFRWRRAWGSAAMEPVLPAPETRGPPSLVRIGDPADLARASAACKAFRRLIADPTFIRRYRSLHPPLLLSFVACIPGRGFLPVDSPHPNAPAARAFAGAADFSFDYVPCSGSSVWSPIDPMWGWSPIDARHGRLLLSPSVSYRSLTPALAVCDPLTRGYTLLPRIPEDLLASVQVQDDSKYINCFGTFFDPSGGREEEAEFRVMCWMHCSMKKAAVFLYSSASGSWTLGASFCGPSPGLSAQPVDNLMMRRRNSYVDGCLYWETGSSNGLIKLDMKSMQRTWLSVPLDDEYMGIVIVDAGEGRIGMFKLILGSKDHFQLLSYSIRQNESENANEHMVETTVPLPCDCALYNFMYCCVRHGYVFLVGLRDHLRPPSVIFSLQVKTMKFEKVCEHGDHIDLIPYFGYPPFLSPRMI